VGACPAGVSARARLDVSMSCRRATVSWPVIPVKRGDRIFTLRPETEGAGAAPRNCTLCCRNLACWEGEEAAEEVAGPADRSSRWREASWYKRPTATQEVGISSRISWKLEVRSTGRGVVSLVDGAVGWWVRVAFAVQREWWMRSRPIIFLRRLVRSSSW
jgi:hypothetical protein